MTNLLALVPWPWRLAGLGLLAVALWGHGYVHGYGTRDDAADLFEAQVQVLGEQAAARALERKAEQDRITFELELAHEEDRRSIAAFYERRMRDADASRRLHAAAPQRPACADGAAPEPAPRREDPAAVAFERDCALDAEQVMKLQDFLLRNNFPVK